MTVLKYKEFVEQQNNFPRTLVNPNTDLAEDDKRHYFKTIIADLKKTLIELYDIKDKRSKDIIKKFWSMPETKAIIEDCLGKYPQILPHVCSQRILKELEYVINETE
jgi:hypothetical protein